VSLGDLSLDGTLVLDASYTAEGQHGNTVAVQLASTKYQTYREIDISKADTPEYLKIRGYELV
jgi:hypothetical protein